MEESILKARPYIVYQTTNEINHKIYVGIHLNKYMDPYKFDGYLGSGKHLKSAIKRWGRETFSRKTLFVFDNLGDAKAKEKELVTENFISESNVYNLIEGGSSPPVLKGSDNPWFGKHFSTEHCDKLSRAHVGISPSKEANEKRSKSLKKFYSSSEGLEVLQRRSKRYSGENHHFFGKCLSEEHRQRLSKSRKNRVVKEETKKKVSESLKKFHSSPEGLELRKKQSKNNAGCNNYWYGKSFSKEHRQRISDSLSLSQALIDKRREDIKLEEKTLGWKIRLAEKWGISESSVYYFINKYAPELDITFDNIKKQRREDVVKEPKVWGWKAKLARKWNLGTAAAGQFIKRHANDLL